MSHSHNIFFDSFYQSDLILKVCLWRLLINLFSSKVLSLGNSGSINCFSCPTKQQFLIFNMHQNHQESWLKHKLLGPSLKILIQCCQLICISNKFLVDGGLGTMLYSCIGLLEISLFRRLFVLIIQIVLYGLATCSLNFLPFII